MPAVVLLLVIVGAAVVPAVLLVGSAMFRAPLFRETLKGPRESKEN